MPPDARLLRKFIVLMRIAADHDFRILHAQEMFDAAMRGDRATFRTLHKNAWVAMAQDSMPELFRRAEARRRTLFAESEEGRTDQCSSEQSAPEPNKRSV